MAVQQLVSHVDRSLSGRLLLLGVVAGLFFLGWQMQAARADSHNGTDYFFCVDNRSGNVRLVESPSQCGLRDTPFNLSDDLGLATDADFEALEERIAELEALLDGVARVDDGDTLQFSGMNVQIVNGEGSTDTINELGNFIVGYNESDEAAHVRSGSHNLVVGQEHSYSSYGGFVAGFENTVGAPNATVSGGAESEATGEGSSVSGGFRNNASGPLSSVSGGGGNDASGHRSSVSGGAGNDASGELSSVSGGNGNDASGPTSSVSGGSGNEASGTGSSVSGGVSNDASGGFSSVSGGFENEASGTGSSVSGGSGNEASGISSNVSGGESNDAGGDRSSILGGLNQTTNAEHETIPLIP